MKEQFHGRDSWYEEGYCSCYYEGVIGLVYKMVHRLMERPYDRQVGLSRIIEVGSGAGQHLPSVRHPYSYYLMTDIDADLLPVVNNNSSIVESREMNAEKLGGIPDSSFDRLIATCLLAHLDNPMSALKEWRRVVRHGGSLSIYVAPEPGILLRCTRRLFIYPKQRRLGVSDFELLSYTTHKNHYPAMRAMLKSIFAEDKIKQRRFPLNFPWNFVLFEIWHITIRKPS